MELAVLDKSGKDTGRKVALPKEVFGIEPNDHAIYLDVNRIMAAQRQGTHKAKEKHEIKSSTKKIKKQKGTGTARAGSLKSPLFRGGGRVFGPQPRDYDFKLNKKVRQLARKSALAYKLKEDKLAIVEDFAMEAPKTKEFKKLLADLKVDGGKSLFVLNELEKNIVLSSRNLKESRVIDAKQMSTYDILNSEKLVLSEKSVQLLEELLK